MLLLTEEDITSFGEFQDKTEDSKEQGDGTEQVLQLSLCTMARLTTKKSWKLWGSIGSESMVV